MNEELVLKQLEQHERHLEHHDNRLDKQDDKIDSIEQRDAARDVKIDNLCKEISGLTKATYGLIVAIMTTLFGFVIWYIQSLPQ